jgi:hypothetical protein
MMKGSSQGEWACGILNRLVITEVPCLPSRTPVVGYVLRGSVRVTANASLNEGVPCLEPLLAGPVNSHG